MVTEDYCSYEVAKLLKEKGFDYQGFDYIDFEGEIIRQDRPTLQMAMKWLREKHKLYIGINIEVGDIQMLPSYDFEETVLGYNFVIYNEETLIWAFKDKTPRSYEEAVEAALKYSLRNLIKL